MGLKGHRERVRRSSPAGRERSADPSIRRSVDAVRTLLGTTQPRVAVVLGSGLGALGDAVDGARRMPYGEIPGFPGSTVIGHKGELIAGELEGVPVLLQSGRFHLYEGHDPSVAVLPVRIAAALGIPFFLVTNAAGGVNRNYVPPTLMLIADHINLMWRNPLIGAVQSGEQRFPDMSQPYDRELRVIARDVAREEGIALQEGVYAAVLGPSYETPAEIRMLERLGADAVGMSTVPEVIVARALGIRVLGISSITNYAAGLTPEKLNHLEVLEAGRQVSADLTRLVRGVVARLGRI